MGLSQFTYPLTSWWTFGFFYCLKTILFKNYYCLKTKAVNWYEYSLEGLMLKLKHQYFGHLMLRTDSLEKTLMLGKIEGGRRQGQQRM